MSLEPGPEPTLASAQALFVAAIGAARYEGKRAEARLWQLILRFADDPDPGVVGLVISARAYLAMLLGYRGQWEQARSLYAVLHSQADQWASGDLEETFAWALYNEAMLTALEEPARAGVLLAALAARFATHQDPDRRALAARAQLARGRLLPNERLSCAVAVEAQFGLDEDPAVAKQVDLALAAQIEMLEEEDEVSLNAPALLRASEALLARAPGGDREIVRLPSRWQPLVAEALYARALALEQTDRPLEAIAAYAVMIGRTWTVHGADAESRLRSALLHRRDLEVGTGQLPEAQRTGQALSERFPHSSPRG